MKKLLQICLIFIFCFNYVDANSVDSLFGEVCKIVDTNFYDSSFNGVNWDSLKNVYRGKLNDNKSQLPFPDLINEMLSKLHASHTTYYPIDQPSYYQLADIFSSVPDFKTAFCKVFSDCKVKYTDIGILTEKIGNDYFVSSVFDSSSAFYAGILTGDRIISVDNKPFEPILSFKGKSGSTVTVKVQRSQDSTSIKTFSVKPVEYIPNEMFASAMKNSARIIKHNGIEVAYVHIWSFAGEQYYELLKELITTSLSGAKALIVDLRDGFGGANPDYLNIFNNRIPVITSKLRNGQSWTYDPQWRKPVVLLVNDKTRSGKEIIAYGFKKYRYGKIVGTRTAGAVLGGQPHFLSDGSLLYCAAASSVIDGVNLEGKGVSPDIEVKQDIRYRQGKDKQLEKAISVAAESVK